MSVLPTTGVSAGYLGHLVGERERCCSGSASALLMAHGVISLMQLQLAVIVVSLPQARVVCHSWSRSPDSRHHFHAP